MGWARLLGWARRPAFPPLMSVGEVRMIRRYLRRGDVMLEWGCGGSTLAFHRHVARYYSIEHDPEWYGQVKTALEAAGVKNVTQRLAPPNLPLTDPPNFARSPHERYAQFKDYIETVDELGEASFDRVLIDGRSRPECAERVLRYLTSSSIVFIHDFYNTRYDREAYHAAVFKHYEVIESIEEGQSLVVLRLRG